jgi:Putative beta barrel porin-7 (BBP7)
VARRNQIAPQYQGGEAPQYEGNYAPEVSMPQDTADGTYTEGPYDAAYGEGTTIEAGPPREYQEGEFSGEGPGYYPGAPCDDGSCGTSLYTDASCPGFAWDRLYVRADYLLWWGKGFWAPPLVTTSSAGTPRDEAGILGLPTTSVLFPNGNNLAATAVSGGRVRLGYWLDDCDISAIEGSYFGFPKSTTNFNASDQNFAILARPFVNIETGAVGNDAELVAYPNLFSGNISVVGSSRLQGAELFFRHALCRGCNWRVDGLLGWRYNRLDETLAISDTKTVLSGQTGLTVGTLLSEYDRFSTRNTFNGVQIGVITEVVHCRWWFETRTTLALGNNRSLVNIDGQATAVVPVPNMPDQIIVTPAGLLAQGTNIGAYRNDDFAVVPQLGVSVGYEIICGLWATAGYNFMYWSRVARPGDQIDTDVNLSQLSPGGLVGLPRPAYTNAITDYWAQGLSFGLAYRF